MNLFGRLFAVGCFCGMGGAVLASDTDDAIIQAYDLGDYGRAAALTDSADYVPSAAVQRRLGVMYYMGKGVPADKEKGKAFLHAAMRGGEVSASVNLAKIYMKYEPNPSLAARALLNAVSVRGLSDPVVKELVRESEGHFYASLETYVAGLEDGRDAEAHRSEQTEEAFRRQLRDREADFSRKLLGKEEAYRTSLRAKTEELDSANSALRSAREEVAGKKKQVDGLERRLRAAERGNTDRLTELRNRVSELERQYREAKSKMEMFKRLSQDSSITEDEFAAFLAQNPNVLQGFPLDTLLMMYRKNPLSQIANELGWRYYGGRLGAAVNQEMAKDYYKEAAEKGNVSGIYNFGSVLWADEQWSRAVGLFREADRLGHAKAAYMLGSAYECGHANPPLFSSKSAQDCALECYRRALERGHKEAEKDVERLEYR